MPHPIDALVRHVETNELPGIRDEKHIVLDSKHRPAGSFTIGKRHYLVNVRKSVGRSGLSVPVRSLRGVLNVDVGYQVRCAPDAELTLAMAVAAAVNPQEALDAFIGDQLERFVYEQGIEQFVGNFADSAQRFAQELALRLRDAFGLLIELRLTPGAKVLEARSVGPIILKVRPRDADLSLDVEFEASLRVDSERVALAHLKEADLEQLVQAVVRHTQEFLARSVSLQDLFSDLNGKVLRELSSSLSTLLSEHGRELASPALRCDFKKHPVLEAASDAPAQLQVLFTYKNPNHPSEIHIRASLKLRLDDVARLVAEKVTSLAEWASQAVEKASKDLLFELSWELFCTQFERTKADLKAAMRQSAERIGYSLEDFYSVTDHQIDELLNGVQLGPIEGAFVVRSHKQLKVRLQLEARARIRSGGLEKVMEKVVRNETVQKDMESTLLATAVKFLRRITPEDFYVYFEVPRIDDAPSQRQLLEAELRKVLDESYGAELVEFDVVQLETEVLSLFDRLKRSTQLVDFKVQPSQHPAESFQLEFRVEGVLPDKWDAFQATMPELTDVAAAVQRQLETDLSAFPGEILLTESKAIGEFAATRAVLRAQDSFGLSIRMVTFRRLSNAWELSAGKEVEESRLSEIAGRKEWRETSEAQGRLLRDASTDRIKTSLAKEQQYRDQANEARAADDEARADMLDKIADAEAATRKRLVDEAAAEAEKSRALTKPLTFGESAFSPVLSVAGARQLLKVTNGDAGPPQDPPSNRSSPKAGDV